jgi:hypothetical protein
MSVIGAVNISASMRSIRPPWPGTIQPLSLAPALRLISDSTRSPQTPIGTASSASPTPCRNGRSGRYQKLAREMPISPPPTAPIAPSQVLFGEMLGENLLPLKSLPPRKRPAK